MTGLTSMTKLTRSIDRAGEVGTAEAGPAARHGSSSRKIGERAWDRPCPLPVGRHYDVFMPVRIDQATDRPRPTEHGRYSAKRMAKPTPPEPPSNSSIERELDYPEIPQDELERAKYSYDGSLQSARAWRSFFGEPKYHTTTAWTMFALVFVNPGINRTILIDRMQRYAGVSRSTAERMVADAKKDGFLLDKAERKSRNSRHYLSRDVYTHCIAFFRNWMDFTKIERENA
jgi:hypothetical protein